MTAVLEFLPSVMSGMLIGHINANTSKEYIAAQGLAYLFILVTSVSAIIGIGTALDTLCAQAYGAGKLLEIGVLFQAGLICGAVLLVPLAVVNFFCTDILLMIGQQQEVQLCK